MINRQTAKEAPICHQLRSLLYVSAWFDFDPVARHTPGVKNAAADAISRNKIFFLLTGSGSISCAIPHLPRVGLGAQPTISSVEIARLDSLAQVYFGQALAPTARGTYQSAHRRYLDFCSSINVRPLPITQCTLCLFVTQLASQGVSNKSIKGYLSALRYLQIAADGSEPGISGMATLGYIVLGIKRVQGRTGACALRPRLPITAAIMRVLKRSWETHGASFKGKLP